MEKEQPQVHPRNGEGNMPQLAPERTDAGESSVAGEVPVGGGAPGQSSAETFEEFKKRHARTSVQRWTKMVLDAVEKDQWTLVIDDLSEPTPSTGRLVSRLSGKFRIVAALHEVKKKDEKHFWRFEKISLGNLPKEDARRLIHATVAGADVEDMALFETRILQESAGNPRAILESVDRLKKEPSITRNAVRELSHTGARSKIDLTWVIILLIVPLIAARFIARGMGDMELYVLAGVASALAMAARIFMFRLRR